MARTKGAVAKGVDNTAVRIFLRGYGSLGSCHALWKIVSAVHWGRKKRHEGSRVSEFLQS